MSKTLDIGKYEKEIELTWKEMERDMYQKNPVGELLAEINEQYIEDNIEILQDYFQSNDDIGMMCNKDNIEDYFENWLFNMEYRALVEIIEKSKHE